MFQLCHIGAYGMIFIFAVCSHTVYPGSCIAMCIYVYVLMFHEYHIQQSKEAGLKYSSVFLLSLSCCSPHRLDSRYQDAVCVCGYPDGQCTLPGHNQVQLLSWTVSCTRQHYSVCGGTAGD